MRLRIALLTFLCLLTLILLPGNSRSEDTGLCFGLEDSQKLYLCIEENPILREKIVTLDERIKNLEREMELCGRENEVNVKLLELAERERDIYRSAFDREKELTDRAIKLAETSKPTKGIWAVIAGVLLAFGIGLAIGL